MHVKNRWLFSLCVINGWLYTYVYGVQQCDKIKDKCISRIACGMALHNFYLGCDSVLHGYDAECTSLCRKALVSLLYTEDEIGVEFVNCDCNGVELCEKQKARIELCTTKVLEALDTVKIPGKTISCTLAKWVCEADVSCLTAIQYYQDHCARMFAGEKCTFSCNNSLHILYQQKRAKKLEKCTCEGDEGFDCYKVRANTNKLCFNIETPYSHQYLPTKSHNTANGDSIQNISYLCVFIVIFNILTFFCVP